MQRGLPSEEARSESTVASKLCPGREHSRAFESTQAQRGRGNVAYEACTSALLAIPRDRSENPGVGGSIRPCPTVFRVLPRHRLDDHQPTLPRTLPTTCGELHGSAAQHRLVYDRVTPIHALGLVADHLHGHGAGTPARSRFLTAVRRKSCKMRPSGSPSRHAWIHAFLRPQRPAALGPVEHPRMALPVLFLEGCRSRLANATSREVPQWRCKMAYGQHQRGQLPRAALLYSLGSALNSGSH